MYLTTPQHEIIQILFFFIGSFIHYLFIRYLCIYLFIYVIYIIHLFIHSFNYSFILIYLLSVTI